MKVILGLGNPGKEYENTRNNAGRIAAEYFSSENDLAFEFDKKSNSFVAEGKIGKNKITIALPETFMNKSGMAAAKLVKPRKELKDLIVIHDDLDLPLGKIKISYGKNSGGHKGVESIMRALKTKKFVRIRVGISGKKKPPNTLKFIIGKFKPDEQKILKKVCKKISEALNILITESLDKAMSICNS